MRPIVVDFGSALAVPLSTHGLYPAEDGYRWTNGQGEIALPSPGGGRAVRLDMVVSAWRPRGTPAPQLRVIAEGASVVAEPGPAPVALSLAADTGHSVRGALDVRLESERFVPGRGDPRTLGVRLHQVRLSPAGGLLQPGLPPLAPVLWALAAVQLLFWIGVRIAGGPDARVFRAGLLAAAVVAIGLAVARAWTVWLLPAAAVGEAVLLLVVAVVPQHVRRVGGVIARRGGPPPAAGRALEPGPMAALAVLAVVGTVVAYWMQPIVVIPMGSGRETAFEDGLGSFDARDGVRFRHVATRAALDLRDLGGRPLARDRDRGRAGRAASSAARGRGRAASWRRLLGPEWSTHEIVARAPWGWRSGLTLAFPGSRRDDLWLREVRIDRGRAWPSLRIVTCVIAAGLLLALALRASGLGGRAAWGGAAAFVVLRGRRHRGRSRGRPPPRAAPRRDRPAGRDRDRAGAVHPRAAAGRRGRAAASGSWPGWPRPRRRSIAAATSSSIPRSRRRSGRAGSSSTTCPTRAAC